MARITVTIEANNAAFYDDEGGEAGGYYAALETARILRDVADRMLTDGLVSVPALFDYNGNRVGAVTVEN